MRLLFSPFNKTYKKSLLFIENNTSMMFFKNISLWINRYYRNNRAKLPDQSEESCENDSQNNISIKKKMEAWETEREHYVWSHGGWKMRRGWGTGAVGGGAGLRTCSGQLFPIEGTWRSGRLLWARLNGAASP